MQQSEKPLKMKKQDKNPGRSSGFCRKKKKTKPTQLLQQGVHSTRTGLVHTQRHCSIMCPRQAGLLQVTQRGSPSACSCGEAELSTALSSPRLLGLRTVLVHIKGQELLVSESWPLLQCAFQEKEHPTLPHSSARTSVFKSLLDQLKKIVKSISGSVHTQFCDPLRTLEFFVSLLLIPFPLCLIHWYLPFLEPVPFIIITADTETFRLLQMN